MSINPKEDGWKKTIQLMPADGWFARFRTPEGPTLYPLISWALVEFTETKDRYLEGFCLQPDGLTPIWSIEQMLEKGEIDNFVGYVFLRDYQAPAGAEIFTNKETSTG